MTTTGNQAESTVGATPRKTTAADSSRFDWWSRRAEAPTYEVVGPLERFDLRDSVASRASLVPGTDAYREYYARHPELEEGDKRVRRYRHLYPTVEAQNRKRGMVYRREPLALALSYADAPAHHLALRPEGYMPEEKVSLKPEVAARNVKAVARYLGADLVGISELNPAWVYSYRSDQGRYGEPIELGHRYAVSIAVAHDFDFQLAARGHSLSSQIETEQVAFNKTAVTAYRLASFVRGLGWDAMQHLVGGLVLNVPLAVDAGLGEESRAGWLITKEFGPAVRLAAVTTDLPLAVDRPVNMGIQDFCTKCRKCATVCPTHSITPGGKDVIRGVKHWPFDARGCYRLRQALGNTPCMYCLSACPWTKPTNIIHQTAAELAVRLPMSRRPLMWLDDFLYGRKPRLHPYPDWLQHSRRPAFGEKLVTWLHKI